MNISRVVGVAVVGIASAVVYGDEERIFDGSAEKVLDSVGAVVQGALDLSDVWDKRNADDEPILWSSLGWEDVEEPESGKTVTLQLVPRSVGDPQTLASGLKGHRQTSVWTPGEVIRQVYNVRHVVVGGSPLETDLNAYFSFENYDRVMPNELAVRAAIRFTNGTGWGFDIENDVVNWWSLVGGPGDGISAPQGDSVLAFKVNGHGVFLFDYTLVGGKWTVKVDGAEVRTMSSSAGWTGVELPVGEGFVAHVIEFVTDLSVDGLAELRNVRWVDTDKRFGGGRVDDGAVDLREGVLVVRRTNELMPFTWSSTNFTGNVLVKNVGFVTIGSQSVASVRVVRLTGESEDVSQWTTEVPDTAKALVSEKQGEGTVKWRGAKPGVWKADFVIRTNGDETCRETRILDLREYVGDGMVLFVM